MHQWDFQPISTDVSFGQIFFTFNPPRSTVLLPAVRAQLKLVRWSMMARLNNPNAYIGALHNRPMNVRTLTSDFPLAGASGGPDAMLKQACCAAHIGIWEAWESPIELIRFLFNEELKPLFGLAATQVHPGVLWQDNVYPPDRVRLQSYLLQWDPAAPWFSVDYRLIVGEGELLWVRHWTLSRSHAPNQRPWIRNMLIPIPEQKHLEWECLRVSERECNRIGQELHDDLCQVLAGLTFMMRVVGQKAHHIDASLAGEIDELNTHIAAATERVRSMAHGLFPAQLRHSSVREALQAYAAEAETLFHIRVSLNLGSKIPRHTPEQIIQVYRIAQEAVNNAVRHGHASTVNITMAKQRLGLELRIEDDGRGFPEASVRPEGIGLHVMQYRARVLGGTIEFKNLSPRGVAARLTYPIAHTTHGQPSKPIPMP